ncbi:uncharacterized protein [Aristolochia californica]|uniref:uncharacterized protein n=1 Tax=Aristolochia californica TaxID=171875 RepID=UPI0035E19C38
MASVVDLMLFHKMERDLYKRLISMEGMGAEMAKAVIALWLWMESIGHHDLVRRIFELALKDEQYLRSVVNEGEACVNALTTRQGQPVSASHDDIPITANLLNEPINLRFFHYNRDVALQGVTHFLQRICNVIFHDDAIKYSTGREEVVLSAGLLMSAFDHDHNSKRMMLGLGGSSSPNKATNMMISSSASAAAGSSTLNPMAKPWSPPYLETNSGGGGQDLRSMFLTFSRGYPLSRDEIINFFRSSWGDCVESLMIEKTPAGVDPMFGRVVFSNASLIRRILNGNFTAQFVINGKHLRARLFIPRARN